MDTLRTTSRKPIEDAKIDQEQLDDTEVTDGRLDARSSLEIPEIFALFDGLSADRPHRLDLTGHVDALVVARDDEIANATGIETDIDRVSTTPEPAHADAIANPVANNPTVAEEAGGYVTPLVAMPRSQLALRPDQPHDLVRDGPKLHRDRVALLDIVRFRVLAFRDVHARVFGPLHKAVVTRRMQALERAGFIIPWEEQLVVGGHPRYAVPTKKGLDWALAELDAEARGTPAERLVAFMRGEQVRPLVLQPRTAPPFLPHQMETNRVVAALEAIPELGITWASTWHRPFPNHLDRIALPQPDAVLLAQLDGAPHLIFLEHDRGQEAPASFARKKAERYHEFSLYDLAEELFGIRAFTVWVTVNDVAEQKPLHRIRALQDVSKNARMMRFTLAGWIPGHAAERPVWFAPWDRPTGHEHTPLAHPNLRGPFAGANDTAVDAPGASLLRQMRAGDRLRRKTTRAADHDPFDEDAFFL